MTWKQYTVLNGIALAVMLWLGIIIVEKIGDSYCDMTKYLVVSCNYLLKSQML